MSDDLQKWEGALDLSSSRTIQHKKTTRPSRRPCLFALSDREKKNNPKKKNVDRSSNHDVFHTFRSCIADTLMRTAPREKKKKEKKKKKLMTTQKRKKLLDDTPISTSTLRLVDAK